MHLGERLTYFINILLYDFQLLKFNLHLKNITLFKLRLIKIYLSLIMI